MKSTAACMYRGNALLAVSGEFGEEGLLFFFQISYFCHPTVTNLRNERRFAAARVR